MNIFNFVEIIKGDFDENYETREQDRRIWGEKRGFTFFRNDRADQYEFYTEEEKETIKKYIEDFYERFMIDPQQAYEDIQLNYNLVGYKEYRNGNEELDRVMIVHSDDENEKDLDHYIEDYLKIYGRSVNIQYVK